MSFAAKAINWGVDYLRVTSQNEHDKAILEQEFQRVLRKDKALGYESHSGGAFGFWGTATRHGMLAHKEDWSMLQVSGRLAKGMEEIARGTQNCTRIDVQVTVDVGVEEVANFIRQQYENACDAPNVEGRPRKVKMIEENRKAQTVYIGSRASDYFMRIYDKFAESGDENYKGCVRIELEIKGKTSKGMWRRMATERLGEGYLIETLCKFAERVGVEIPDRPGGASVEVYKPILTKSIDHTMAWLQRSVKPSVARCVAEFGWLIPLRILLEDVITEAEFLSVSQNLALVWGT